MSSDGAPRGDRVAPTGGLIVTLNGDEADDDDDVVDSGSELDSDGGPDTPPSSGSDYADDDDDDDDDDDEDEDDEDDDDEDDDASGAKEDDTDEEDSHAEYAIGSSSGEEGEETAVAPPAPTEAAAPPVAAAAPITKAQRAAKREADELNDLVNSMDKESQSLYLRKLLGERVKRKRRRPQCYYRDNADAFRAALLDGEDDESIAVLESDLMQDVLSRDVVMSASDSGSEYSEGEERAPKRRRR
jgi:hypothetical protein